MSLNVNNNVSDDIYSEKRAADDIIDCVRPTKNILAFRRIIFNVVRAFTFIIYGGERRKKIHARSTTTEKREGGEET